MRPLSLRLMMVFTVCAPYAIAAGGPQTAEREALLRAAETGTFWSRAEAVVKIGDTGDPSYVDVLYRLAVPPVDDGGFLLAVCIARAKLLFAQAESPKEKRDYLLQQLEGECDSPPSAATPGASPYKLRLWAMDTLVNSGDKDAWQAIEEQLRDPLWGSRRDDIAEKYRARLDYSMRGTAGLLEATEDETRAIAAWAFERLLARTEEAESIRNGLSALVARIEAEYQALVGEHGLGPQTQAFEHRWSYVYCYALSTIAVLGGEDHFASNRVFHRLATGGTRPAYVRQQIPSSP